MDSWIEEINRFGGYKYFKMDHADCLWRHTNLYTLAFYKYHGQNRNIALHELLSHDVILTTYGTLAADFKRRQSFLYKIRWYRVILDEGGIPHHWRMLVVIDDT